MHTKKQEIDHRIDRSKPVRFKTHATKKLPSVRFNTHATKKLASGLFFEILYFLRTYNLNP